MSGLCRSRRALTRPECRTNHPQRPVADRVRQKEHAVRDVRDALYVARNTDGQVIRRPMSPHLQVWRWPIAMAVSICHRVTGVGLSIGTLLLTWWLIAAATSDSAFATVQWFLGSPIGLLALLGWTLSLTLHFCSGIRHLAWDAGWGYEPRAYRLTSVIVFACGIGGAALIFGIGLSVWW